MRAIFPQFVRNFSACLLAVLFAAPVSLVAETAHVVSPSDLQQQAVAASQVRQQNVQKVRDFLSTPLATKAMQDAKIDAQQVKDAVASLDDQELSQLAARADKAQKDFAAGYLSTRDIVLIVLGVVVIILIIVIAA
jgi:hypothetical protein